MKKLLLATAATLLVSGTANAAFVDTDIPDNAYITQGSLDWAWGRPLPFAGEPTALDFQSQFGWRLPTLDELMAAPDATDFIFDGANVALGGVDPISGARFQATNANLTGAAACATPYFSATFRHCDWQDGNGQRFEPWAGTPGAQSFADQLFVRRANMGAVPEPATWAFMIFGFGAIGGAMRRQRKANVKVSYV